jgi:hypothetical protein
LNIARKTENRNEGRDLLPSFGLEWYPLAWTLVAQETQSRWLYRLALHFHNLKRTARRFVIEHGDHQPPGIPSERVEVRSVIF